MPTAIAPRLTVAQKVMIHSGLLAAQIATRSPWPTPYSSRSAVASAATCRPCAAKVSRLLSVTRYARSSNFRRRPAVRPGFAGGGRKHPSTRRARPRYGSRTGRRARSAAPTPHPGWWVGRSPQRLSRSAHVHCPSAGERLWTHASAFRGGRPSADCVDEDRRTVAQPSSSTGSTRSPRVPRGRHRRRVICQPASVCSHVS